MQKDDDFKGRLKTFLENEYVVFNKLFYGDDFFKNLLFIVESTYRYDESPGSVKVNAVSRELQDYKDEGNVLINSLKGLRPHFAQLIRGDQSVIPDIQNILAKKTFKGNDVESQKEGDLFDLIAERRMLGMHSAHGKMLMTRVGNEIKAMGDMLGYLLTGEFKDRLRDTSMKR